MKFEYLTRLYSLDEGTRQLEILGEEGWLLVSAMPVYTSLFQYIFVREKCEQS